MKAGRAKGETREGGLRRSRFASHLHRPTDRRSHDRNFIAHRRELVAVGLFARANSSDRYLQTSHLPTSPAAKLTRERRRPLSINNSPGGTSTRVSTRISARKASGNTAKPRSWNSRKGPEGSLSCATNCTRLLCETNLQTGYSPTGSPLGKAEFNFFHRAIISTRRKSFAKE